MSASNEHVYINDVGPRDGLQNHARILEPSQRLRLINSLVDAGLGAVEAGAFVSPRAVPAMSGTDTVLASLNNEAAEFSVLIPNRRGYELARDAGARTVNLVVAASDTMNRENIRMSTADALAVAQDIITLAEQDRIRVQAYIATAWECPFKGKVPGDEVMRISRILLEAGATGIVLADTIGAAGPGAVRELSREVVSAFGNERVSCHFHDTRAFGVANVYAALEVGVRRFDASIGGLGGCPFAPGASGNVATEDLVLLLGQEGFHTGINLARLLETVNLLSSLTETCVGGRASNWLSLQAEKGRLQDDRVLSAPYTGA